MAGLSDHTLGIGVPVTACALGARIVEKHFIKDREEGGPDSAFSLEPAEFKDMIDTVRVAEKAIGKIHYGGVKGEVRDQIRSIVEKEDNALIVASYGTFSTGVNIKRIDNIVFAAPSKSKIRVLQSIGRGLRLAEDKNSIRLYDVVDDLRYKKWNNFVLRHYTERLKIYNDEQFDYKIHSYKLGD